MELFTKYKTVKLRSHHDKYLVADDGGQTARQSRNGSSHRAQWAVEPVRGRQHLLRLKSCHGHYLTASPDPFLLGVTGKKVLQTPPDNLWGDWTVEWEPIRDGFQVRLKSWCGKYLRANGGTPPWRNSVTHDEPHGGATQNWVLWDVEPVEGIVGSQKSEGEKLRGGSFVFSVTSSFSSVSDNDGFGLGDGGGRLMADSDVRSPITVADASKRSEKTQLQHPRSGMEFFRKAKVVRLRSRHDKYLLADDDEETVTQDRDGTSPNAKWTVEYVLNSESIVRLKSRFGKYLTASNVPFLLGMTGRKVLQTLPRRLDSSIEWEPLREGTHVKLQTRYGNFLRANGGLPPWRNSVTHDVPHRSSTQDWVLWDVDVVEIEVEAMRPVEPLDHLDSIGPEGLESELGSPSSASTKSHSGRFSTQESNDSNVGSPPKSDGRTVHYHIADENGNVEGEDMEGYTLNFKGNNVEELTRKLEEETGMQGIVLCSRSPLNGKLFPLRLQLPPNITTMHIVVVPSSSTVARDFQ